MYLAIVATLHSPFISLFWHKDNQHSGNLKFFFNK
jgi:hypothetical protein